MDMVNTHNAFNEDNSEPDRSTIMGLRPVALVEIVAFLLLAVIWDVMFRDGSRFADVNPHPFLFIVLLLTVQYGSISGLVAAIACVFVYFVGNSAISVASLSDSSMGVIINPAIWLIVSLVFGAIRDRHVKERNRLQSKLREALAREHVTAEAYGEVRDRKQRLEERVASEMRSALTVYQSAKSLETMSPNHLMRAVERMIRDLLGAEVFSMFLMESNVLNASITSNWHGQYASLPRRYSPASALYQTVVSKRDVLTVANADHEQVLAGEGVLAAPLVNSAGEVLGMIKIESLPFAQFGVHTVETLRLIAEWTAAALSNARHYESALGSAVEDPRNKLLTSSYFERYTQYVISLGKRAKFPVTLVGVGLALPQDIAEGDQIRVARLVSDAVRESLRNVDLAFDYQQGGAQYSVVLPTTTREGAEVVRDKITASLEQKLRTQDLRYPFTTTVQELVA
jgi:hypothetical protein